MTTNSVSGSCKGIEGRESIGFSWELKNYLKNWEKGKRQLEIFPLHLFSHSIQVVWWSEGSGINNKPEQKINLWFRFSIYLIFNVFLCEILTGTGIQKVLTMIREYATYWKGKPIKICNIDYCKRFPFMNKIYSFAHQALTWFWFWCDHWMFDNCTCV